MNIDNQKGMGLLEVIVAVAIFTIGIATVIHLYVGSHYASISSVERNQAILIAREGIEAVRSIRDESFSNVTTTSGGVEINENNKWVITEEPNEIDNKFIRIIDITEENNETWHVTSTVSWESHRGRNVSVSLAEKLTIWREIYNIE